MQFRQNFEDQLVGVHLGEILRHLALPERIEQGVVDHLRRYAEPCRGIAVNADLHRGAAIFLIGRQIAQLRQVPQLGKDFGRPAVKLRRIRALQRVLILRA